MSAHGPNGSHSTSDLQFMTTVLLNMWAWCLHSALPSKLQVSWALNVQQQPTMSISYEHKEHLVPEALVANIK